MWILPFLALMGCSQSKNDRTDMNLKGNVKSVWERTYVADINDDVALKGKLMQSIKFVFNKQGRMEEVDWFDMDGDTVKRVCSEYDKNNVLVKRRIYNEFGKADGCSIFKHDEKGRVIETLFLDVDEYLVEREVIEYNDDNLIETSIIYGSKGEIVKKEVRQLDKKGLPKEIKIYNDKRELVNYRKEVYDESERLSQFTVYAADEQTILLMAALTYDNGGNLIKQEALDENGEAYQPDVYKYKFDKKSNWISNVQYVGDVAQTLTEREIVYY